MVLEKPNMGTEFRPLGASLVFCGLLLITNCLVIPRNEKQNGVSKRAVGGNCQADIDPSPDPFEIVPDTESVNETKFYKKNLDCFWTVNAHEGHVILLTSQYFAVERSDGCVWDYLEVRDGADFPQIVRFCGWDNFEYLSKTNHLVIRFVTDESYEDEGFKIRVTQHDTNDEKSLICLRNEIPESHISIVNRAEVAQGCYYRIDAPAGEHIQVTIKMIQFGVSPCDEEALLVYHGPSTQSEKTQACSDYTNNSPIDIRANTILVHYKNHQAEGERFELRYKFIPEIPAPTVPPTPPSPVGGHADCSKLLHNFEESEVIYNTPAYENNKECILVVKNTDTKKKDYVVEITFTDFDMENSTDCMFDSLKVFAGDNSDSPQLGGPYCGESLKRRTLVTNGNALRLEYKTDESFALLGFEAKIRFVERDSCSCPRRRTCVMDYYEKLCFSDTCSDYCHNGGTCVVTKATKSCYCPSGFTGETCTSPQPGKRHFGFKYSPESQFHKEGEAVFVECLADTPDHVEYSWLFNGEIVLPFTPAGGFGVDHSGGQAGSVLQISKFGAQYEGDYVCRASTFAGTAEHVLSLHQKVPCAKDKIHTMTGPADKEANVGETIHLTCSTEPTVDTIKWKKDGRYIEFESEVRFKQLINGNLVISDLEVTDSGKYTCEAITDDLCSEQRSGELSVLHVHGLKQYCGRSIYDLNKSTSKISAGDVVKPKDQPWYVRLQDAIDNRTFCGGSLISKRFVLTAAHCISEFQLHERRKYEDSVHLYLGTNDCTGTSGTVRTPMKVHIHHDYNKIAKFDADIAIIEMDSPIEYPDDKSILPICLAPADEVHNRFLEGRKIIGPMFGQVVGCGSSHDYRGSWPSHLMRTDLPYMAQDACSEAYETETITENMFCAGGEGLRRSGNVCQGSSGSPLIMADTVFNHWVLTGMVSFGKPCRRAVPPTVFTNVGKFYDWINNITSFAKEVFQAV